MRVPQGRRLSVHLAFARGQKLSRYQCDQGKAPEQQQVRLRRSRCCMTMAWRARDEGRRKSVSSSRPPSALNAIFVMSQEAVKIDGWWTVRRIQYTPVILQLLRSFQL